MARVDAPSRARAQAKPSLLRWALVRAGILYVLSVLFLTCPSRPGHPVCQIGAFTQSNLVSPLHDLALATETGARIDAAYRAHLVPFYQVHAAPAVHGARAFIVESAVPAAKQAVGPACDAVHRALDPHAARAAAMYAAHAKPAVDAVKHGVCAAARRVVVPVCSAAARQARVVLAEHVGPAARSCVRDYVVPFFANHVQPRWNRQVRPALAHYARVAVRYTRSSVLPALADGAAHGVRSARQLAATHVVPHARRATVAVYVFVKSNVCPPVRRAYALTLKPHVDRVVPWDRVDPVVGRLWAGTWALVDVAQTFIEECYYMAYTIVTGAEHPSVLAKQRARDDAATAAKTSTLDALKLAGDQGQQIHDMARKFSGSARQWIQVARGWVGAAAGSAKDNLAAYGSRATATAKDMWGQAATEAVPAATEAAQSAATMATEAAAEQASEVSEKLKVYVQTVESAVQQAYESRAAQATEEAEPVVSEATAVVESVESAVADTVVESVESLATEEVVGGVESVVSLVTETVVGVVESVESAAAGVVEPVVSVESVVTDKAAEVVVSVESVVTDKAADFVDSAASIEGAVESAASDLAESAASVGTAVVDSAASIESVVTDSAASIDSIVADSAVSAKSAATDAAADIVTEPLSQAAAAVSEAVESPAAITSAIASKLEEKLDAAPSLPVPSLDTSAVAPNVSLVAEDAASAMYKARDAMAGVLVGDAERGQFSELVKSASEGVENLENFPSILDDARSAVVSKVSSVEQVAEDKVEEKTEKPKPTEKTEREEKPSPAVEKVVEQVVSQPAAEKVADKAEKVVDKVESFAERAVGGSEPAEPLSSEQPPMDNVVLEEPTAKQAAAESKPAGSSDSVDEDVRKSASNWVKDARKSISKELAEERTRTTTADATTTLSEGAKPADSPIAAEPAAPEASAVQMDETKPVTVSATTPTKPKAERRDAAPSKTAAAKPSASKSDKAVPAAEVPAPDTTVVAPKPAATKGPRKIKKTKKRVVKKTP